MFPESRSRLHLSLWPNRSICWNHDLVPSFCLKWQKLFVTVLLRQMFLGNLQISQVSREMRMNMPPSITSAMFQIHTLRGNPEDTTWLQRKCMWGATGAVCPVVCASFKSSQYSWWSWSVSVVFSATVTKRCYSKVQNCPLSYKKKKPTKPWGHYSRRSIFYLALHTCFPASIWFIRFVTKDGHKWETKATEPYLHQNNFTAVHET